MKKIKTMVVLAMTADGKIADKNRSRTNFASKADKQHLREQIAQLDALLFGAGTLRAYGTTITIPNSQWQPINIVVSASGLISPQLPFFQQIIPRWLITTEEGSRLWHNSGNAYFERIIIFEDENQQINWHEVFTQLSDLGVEKLGILGGGNLVASLAEEDLLDEFWFTICPFILGGKEAPTPLDGLGLPSPQALELLEVKQIDQEIFLHYRKAEGS